VRFVHVLKTREGGQVSDKIDDPERSPEGVGCLPLT
jgi:hypothetical protein